MNVFSIYHFLYLTICILICISFYFIFRNKSEKTKYIATFIPLAMAFVVHFLKLLIPYYKDDLPQSLSSITFETICAISTLTFPFIYISKSSIFKNYMVVMGLISGVLTLLFPMDLQAIEPFNIETIRFFFAHLTIFMSPLFMCIFNIYRPKGKWIKHTLLVFMLVIFIAYNNNLLLELILN